MWVQWAGKVTNSMLFSFSSASMSPDLLNLNESFQREERATSHHVHAFSCAHWQIPPRCCSNTWISSELPILILLASNNNLLLFYHFIQCCRKGLQGEDQKWYWLVSISGQASQHCHMLTWVIFSDCVSRIPSNNTKESISCNQHGIVQVGNRFRFELLGKVGGI